MAGTDKPRWVISGVIEAPVDEVAKILFDIRPGRATADNDVLHYATYMKWWGGAPLIVEGGPTDYRVKMDKPGGHVDKFTVDRDRLTLTSQGNWWYRGVHSLEPHERGTRIVHRVYNIAPGAGQFIVPLMQLRLKSEMKDGMKRLFDQLGKRLKAKAYVE